MCDTLVPCCKHELLATILCVHAPRAARMAGRHQVMNHNELVVYSCYCDTQEVSEMQQVRATKLCLAARHVRHLPSVSTTKVALEAAVGLVTLKLHVTRTNSCIQSPFSGADTC